MYSLYSRYIISNRWKGRFNQDIRGFSLCLPLQVYTSLPCILPSNYKKKQGDYRYFLIIIARLFLLLPRDTYHFSFLFSFYFFFTLSSDFLFSSLFPPRFLDIFFSLLIPVMQSSSSDSTRAASTTNIPPVPPSRLASYSSDFDRQQVAKQQRSNYHSSSLRNINMVSNSVNRTSLHPAGVQYVCSFSFFLLSFFSNTFILYI